MSDWSPVTPVTPEVNSICLQVKPQVVSMAGANFAVYTPLDFISKNEAGVNYTYIVKVSVEKDKCVHAKISQAGEGQLNLEAIRYPKNMDDPLVPF
ncbi:cystatin-B-like protein [Labeo rohita]|uniref:Cystatin-B-like protein n=2 Tax=Labeo rohita TaxID=84645 RepID=A0A498P094_LABRO|nr:cystatin-A [Labeo rohita]KAI2665052.1 Cystatin-A [Labeo rohita]RXN31549.1 cystatin-B-like protein [Labeo rohita]RXN31550.1 cystatin-B-like protein [Labeo rohita]RXN37581.1 cystatin-B-like protein [Labeo rohita]